MPKRRADKDLRSKPIMSDVRLPPATGEEQITIQGGGALTVLE